MSSSVISLLVLKGTAGLVGWIVGIAGLALIGVGTTAFLVECIVNPEPVKRSEAKETILSDGMLLCWFAVSIAHKIFAFTGSHIGLLGFAGVGLAFYLVHNAIVASAHEGLSEFTLVYEPEELNVREVLFCVGFFAGGIAGDLVLLFAQILTNIPSW